jgi:hypothetical protein
MTNHTFPRVLIGHGAIVTKYHVLTSDSLGIITTIHFFQPKENCFEDMSSLCEHEEELMPKFNKRLLNITEVSFNKSMQPTVKASAD